MNMIKRFAAVLAATAVASVSMISGMVASAALTARDDGPYIAYLAFQAGTDMKQVSEKDNAILVKEKNNITGTEAAITDDGRYSVDVTMGNGSGTIETMILETNINAYAFAPEGTTAANGSLPNGCTASIVIDSIEIQRVDGSTVSPVAYAGETSSALCTAEDNTSIRLNILNQAATPKVNALSGGANYAPDGGLAAGDKVVVNFTVSGISAATTTTTSTASTSGTTTPIATATTTTVAVATATNGNGNASSGTSGNATTSKTGDFGIAAIVLGAVATAALGVGAYTVTKKKK